jgi:hypothetical protein
VVLVLQKPETKMVAMLAGTVKMIALLTSAWPPAAQIFKSATDMYGYFNTTSNTNLSGLERIHDAFSQVHNTTCCSVIYYHSKPMRPIPQMGELPKKGF